MNILDYFKLDQSNPGLLDLGFDEFKDPADMLAEEDTIVRAVTVTLHPKLHGINPKLMTKKFKNDIISLFHRARKDIYIEAHFELTKNFIWHSHLAIYAKSRYHIAKFLAFCRKSYGFCIVKEVKNLSKWLDYIDKENVFKPFKFRVR